MDTVAYQGVIWSVTRPVWLAVPTLLLQAPAGEASMAATDASLHWW